MTDLTSPTRSPSTWLGHIMGCAKCSPASAHKPGHTGWISGDEKPSVVGWFERLFTDGVFRHWWDGENWLSQPGRLPHWRQVGDYPCWRGLTHMAFVRGKVQ